MSKPDFSPLLSPGFHQFSLSALRQSFVVPFPRSQRRWLLLASFLRFYLELRALGVKGEVWLDGSFVCKKVDPDDVDVLVVFDPVSITGLSLAHRTRLEHLLDNAKAKRAFNCDVYTVCEVRTVQEYPTGVVGSGSSEMGGRPKA